MRIRRLLPLVFLVVCKLALAAPLPKNELERSCWLRHTAERTRVNLKEPTAVDFSNLKSGYKLRSPFVVDFAVRGMGVVPAGNALKGAGHHHVLVDQSLPTSITEKIPFSDHHKHFGKGQTFAVLDLPPGPHRLRLLFADHEHRPYFVFSPEITVEVTGPRTAQAPAIDPRNFDATCTAWYQDEMARPRPPGELVSIVNLREGEVVSSPFSVRFGVDGFGVCAAGPTVERTGHFLLEILRDGRLLRSVDLANGATQSNLVLDNGAHVLKLRFVDAGSQRDLLPPSEVPVLVSGQDRL